MCIELTKIPNHIIYTGEADEWMIAGGTAFVVLGAFLLVRHALALLLFKEKAAMLEVARPALTDHERPVSGKAVAYD